MKIARPLIFILLLLVQFTGTFAQSPMNTWDDSLTSIIRRSRSQGLPVTQLENKIREGRAKRKSSAEIYAVVKSRQHHLLQLRDSNNGTLPEEYTRKLFMRERNEDRTPAAARVVTKKVQYRTAPVSPHTNAAQSSPAADTSVSVQRKTPSAAPGQKKLNNRQRNLEKKLRKVEARTERKLTKAAEKAEKRMNRIQKKLEKKSRRKFGAE